MGKKVMQRGAATVRRPDIAGIGPAESRKTFLNTDAAFRRMTAGGSPEAPRNAGLYVNRGEIVAAVEELGRRVVTTDGDIMRSALFTNQEKAAWRAFAAEANTWITDHRDFFPSIQGGTYEQAIEYRKQVDQWRARLLQRGGAPSDVRDRGTKEKSSIVPWVVGGVLGVAVIGGGAYVLAGRRA